VTPTVLAVKILVTLVSVDPNATLRMGFQHKTVGDGVVIRLN
jgi:hypothetical protein